MLNLLISFFNNKKKLARIISYYITCIDLFLRLGIYCIRLYSCQRCDEVMANSIF